MFPRHTQNNPDFISFQNYSTAVLWLQDNPRYPMCDFNNIEKLKLIHLFLILLKAIEYIKN